MSGKAGADTSPALRAVCRLQTAKAFFVNAWNEWAKGFYMLPEEKHCTAYLFPINAGHANAVSGKFELLSMSTG